MLRRRRRVALVLVSSIWVWVSACDATYEDDRSDAGVSRGNDAVAADLAVARTDAVAEGGGSVAADTGILEASPGAATVLRGLMMGRRSYNASGAVELELTPERRVLVFGDDFTVQAVPGPVVVLSKRESLGTSIRPDLGDLELGELQMLRGSQSYALPASQDGPWDYAWVYCKPFTVEIARAKLERVAP